MWQNIYLGVQCAAKSANIKSHRIAHNDSECYASRCVMCTISLTTQIEENGDWWKTRLSTRTRGLRSNAGFQPCELPIWSWFFVSNRFRYGHGRAAMLNHLGTTLWGLICAMVPSAGSMSLSTQAWGVWWCTVPISLYIVNECYSTARKLCTQLLREHECTQVYTCESLVIAANMPERQNVQSSVVRDRLHSNRDNEVLVQWTEGRDKCTEG